MRIIRKEPLEAASWDYTRNMWVRFDGKNANINNILNNEYRNSLPNIIGSKVQESEFKVGMVEHDRDNPTAEKIKPTGRWTGYIGLINLVDYVYTSKSNDCQSNIHNGTCFNDNWLYDPNNKHWTMTGMRYDLASVPLAESTDIVYAVGMSGIYRENMKSRFIYNPVFYLKTDTKIVSGTGTESNPYIIQ